MLRAGRARACLHIALRRLRLSCLAGDKLALALDPQA